MKIITQIAFWLTVIGGINWGLVGLFQLDIVTYLLGAGLISRIIFIAVGASALWLIFDAFSMKSKK
ncbi:MAG: DUF378 domain-containing protein [Lactobacillales bacterium]|jgi:uncharacterized membrane protein YuzA (DUF378 family)|nr:DUF378 domain-containing protein [Lactobacillales bacterium]